MDRVEAIGVDSVKKYARRADPLDAALNSDLNGDPSQEDDEEDQAGSFANSENDEDDSGDSQDDQQPSADWLAALLLLAKNYRLPAHAAGSTQQNDDLSGGLTPTGPGVAPLAQHAANAVATGINVGSDFKDLFVSSFQAAAVMGVNDAVIQLQQDGHPVRQSIVDLHESVSGWASQRGDELAAMVDDSTASMLVKLAQKAADDELTFAQIIESFEESYVFSDERTEVIGATSVAEADGKGNLDAYEAAEVVHKMWVAEADCCSICAMNTAAGHVGINEPFPSGDDTRPAHPNCRCEVIPIFDFD